MKFIIGLMCMCVVIWVTFQILEILKCVLIGFIKAIIQIRKERKNHDN
jgi:hypothetical protein